jgi:hypothetical protein
MSLAQGNLPPWRWSAGHSDGLVADRAGPGNRLFLAIEEHVAAGGQGSPFPEIEGAEAAGFGLIDQGKPAAADACGKGLNDGDG